MTSIFHESPDGRFIEIQSNLRRKKLHKAIKAPVFLEAVLAIERCTCSNLIWNKMSNAAA